MALVYDYIGVSSDGYLRGFSYRSHEEFYSRYCNLTIDVVEARGQFGTTRNTFLEILKRAAPEDQARIVEGVFELLPIEELPEEDRPKRSKVANTLSRAVLRIRGQGVAVEPGVTSDTVRRAIQDADVLIREQGNTSGVDRVHTALHGFLRSLCSENGVSTNEDDDAARLFKLLRTQVPAFGPGSVRATDVAKLHGALATIVDSLSPLRNRASLAHPNEQLLGEAEAALAIDAARTVFNYLSRKRAGR